MWNIFYIINLTYVESMLHYHSYKGKGRNMTPTTGLDQKLLSEVTFLICSTVSECQDYKNPFKVAGEIAKNITSWIQNDRNSRKTAPEHPDNKLVKFDTKIIEPDPAVVKTVERVHADAVQAANNELLKKIQDAELETPGFLTKESDGPTWMSENIKLGEYWVYNYSNPCTTMNGKHGGRAAQTEIWLVHRRTFKFVVVDAEFPSLEDLRDFLDPRKALAAENNITPLEQIDAEFQM